MSEQTKKLLKRIVKNWDKIRAGFVIKKGEYGSDFESPIGNFDWDNPDLIWLLGVSSGGGYDGSATQIGIAKDGKVYWSYQSHCSCNDFENESGIGSVSGEFPPDTTEKHYELNDVPLDWEEKIKKNAEILLKYKYGKTNTK